MARVSFSEGDSERVGGSCTSSRPDIEGGLSIGDVCWELCLRTGGESDVIEPVRMSRSLKSGEGCSLSLSLRLLVLEVVGRASVMR